MKKILCVLLLTVYGCSYPNGESDDLASKQLTKEDRASIYQEEIGEALSVQDVISFALKHNLDARVAKAGFLNELSAGQLQKLNSLPDITAKRDYIKRSNKGASSSESIITGVQSLEPSFSADRSRMTDLLEANWDVLDAAINIYRSKSSSDKALVFKERYKKVEQNIAMDVFSSYWRAYIAQIMENDVRQAIEMSDEKIKAIEQARKLGDIPSSKALSIRSSLLKKRERMEGLLHQFSLAEIELKTLISYPVSKKISLRPNKDWDRLASVDTLPRSMDEYVTIALESRPEIKEEFLNKRISKRTVYNSVLETFPGMSLLLGLNRDDNSFLEEEDWLSFSATVSQSITKLLTLPFRYNKAKKEEQVADAKRHALVAAIISQVYISKSLFDRKYKAYKDQLEVFKLEEDKFQSASASRDAGVVGGVEYLDSQLDYLLARFEKYQGYSEVQSSFSSFVNTVGYDARSFYKIGRSNVNLETG